MRVTTGRGDEGRTRIGSSRIVLKCDLRVKTAGALDELVSFLGLAKTNAKDRMIKDAISSFQRDIFRIMAELGGCGRTAVDFKNTINAQDITRLERLGDAMEKRTGGNLCFVVPGVNEKSAFTHIARAVARRAECLVVELNKKVKLNSFILVYLNRLSDLLFVVAVYQEGKSDILKYAG